MGQGARPLVVVEGRSGILGQPMAVALAAARRAGWEIVRGWAPPSAARFVCTGAVRTPEDARLALRAATSGAGLVVAASAERLTVERLLNDLRRLGPVEHQSESAPQQPAIGGGQRALLGLLAEGLTIRQAATELRIAPSTARRWLSITRSVLGVDSTAAAVVATLTRGR